MKNSDMPAMPVELSGFGQYAPIAYIGMTKREMMAMHIAAGFAADNKITTDNVVKWSIEVADKLLTELDRTCQKS